jgi:hypothetical protein
MTLDLIIRSSLLGQGEGQVTGIKEALKRGGNDD